MTLTDEQIDELLENNAEYAEICETLDSFEKYIYFYNLYFCKKLNDGNYEFSPELAERNAGFLEKWPEKQKKIETRLKKNSYFHSGKKSDEIDLRLGKRKFADLRIYCSLEREFAELEEELKAQGINLQSYIKSLEEQKQKIEKESLKKKKPKQKL